MCSGNGQEGERELRSRGVEERCEEPIRQGRQQPPGGGRPGGRHDHLPRGKSHKFSTCSLHIEINDKWQTRARLEERVEAHVHVETFSCFLTT